MAKWSRTAASIEELLESLKCTICGEILREPATVGRCCHIYCHVCILRLCKDSKDTLCPDCKEPFWFKDIRLDHDIGQIIDLCQKMLPRLTSTVPSEDIPVLEEAKIISSDVEDANQEDLPLENPEDVPLENQEDVTLENQEDLPLENQEDVPLENQEDVPLENQEDVPLENQEDLPLENQKDVPLENQEDELPTYHTPPDAEDPDSYVTASNQSPGPDSSSKTMDLVRGDDRDLKLESIFGASDEDLPELCLDSDSASPVLPSQPQDRAPLVPLKEPEVIFLQTPQENVSQESVHVRPVEKTYLRRGKRKCEVNDWLQCSVFSPPDDEPPKKQSKSAGRRSSVRTRSASSNSSGPVLEIVKTPFKESGVSNATPIRNSRSQRTKPSNEVSETSNSSFLTRNTRTPVSKKSALSTRVSTNTDNSTKTPGSAKSTPSTKTPISKKSARSMKTPVSTKSGQQCKTPQSTPRRNKKGETPLHSAAISGNYEKLKSLLEEGEIPVDSRDNAGWTPLHEACIHKHLACAQLLIDFNAPVNAKSDEHDTALHDACDKDALDIVKLLLDHGACKTLRNIKGFVPADYAVSQPCLDLLASATQPGNLALVDSSSDDTPADPILAFSGLSVVEIAALQKKTNLTFKISEEVDANVTHLVCGVDENKACKRTIKFFKAMTRGLAIVQKSWLAKSITRSQWLTVDDFLVLGAVGFNSDAPKCALQQQRSALPGLFTGLTFYLDRKLCCKPGREEIGQLIESANGKLLAREPKSCTETRVYHAAQNSILHSSPTVIISEEERRTGSFVVKPHTWVLDCISNFNLTV